MSLTYSQLLSGNRDFRNLFFGQVVSELGNWFNFIAALGLVRVVSHAAPEAAAIILVARSAPFAICAMLAGALVDRWSRKTVMIVTDLLRVVIACGFLFVKTADDLWIAYLCTILLSIVGAFFEAAKNASLPNVTGADGLLAGNALMFSSRFLLMSLGAALGGIAAAFFGYEIAFIINAASFIVSAISIWLIPEAALHDEKFRTQNLETETQNPVRKVLTDIWEGWIFIKQNRLVATIISVNIIWAIGGGAINLVADRLGGVTFAGQNGWSADTCVAFLYAAAGAGLFIGMMIARSVGDFVTARQIIVPFIGWTLILQGVLYAVAGQMPNLWLVGLFIVLSRIILGVEYAVQETILMQNIPDNLRGRVLTTDRAAEISIFSLSNTAAGVSLYAISPQTLTVISGLLSAVSGVFWFVSSAKIQIPKRVRLQTE